MIIFTDFYSLSTPFLNTKKKKNENISARKLKLSMSKWKLHLFFKLDNVNKERTRIFANEKFINMWFEVGVVNTINIVV